MTAGFICWLQRIDTMQSATAPLQAEHQQMIIEHNLAHARQRAPALNHGGAID
jgi:hypothetical protein